MICIFNLKKSFKLILAIPWVGIYNINVSSGQLLYPKNAPKVAQDMPKWTINFSYTITFCTTCENV